MSLFALRCGVQEYAWGSTTLMAERFGWPDTDRPQAELWIGAHPLMPSAVFIDGEWSALDALIAEDPQRWIGTRATKRFGPTLPMLMKVLAIDQPLSLQAHPSAAQAVAGFAREDAAGISRTAPERSYRDDRAKPELICALSTMDTLCGFRDLDECRLLLRAVGGSFIAFADALQTVDDLPRLVGAILSLNSAAQQVLVDELVASIGRLPWAAGAVIAKLVDRYPADAGVVVALLLNHITLAPGEALFLPAGNMHAYLSGLGVEVMANSDNVLRGGLTPKHVDVAELVATLTPIDGQWPLAPSTVVDGVQRWSTSAAEVDLARAQVSSVSHPTAFVVSGGPTLFVVSDGTAVIEAEGASIELGAGDAAFALPAASVRVSGFATVWRAAVNFDAG